MQTVPKVATGSPSARLGAVTTSDVAETPIGSPRVSVIVTNYNYARFLRDSVGSALTQEGVDVDVIVVDDASTDDSAAVLAELAAADPRVRVELSPRNRGAVETFNAGLRLAEGEYLVRLDADDLLTPGSLGRAVALAQANPAVALVYGHPVHFVGTPPTRTRAHPSTWTVWSGAEWLELRCRLGVNCITSPEVVMRSSAVHAVGGQRADLPHAHDMEMWLRLATAGDVGHVDGADQALHREHAASLSAVHVDVLGDLHHRSDVFRFLLGAGPARDPRLLDLARRALANESLTRLTQAYAAGRGGTDETQDYLAFARELGVPIEELPAYPFAERAMRLGPRRARRSPSLLIHAARVRARARRAVERTLETGI